MKNIILTGDRPTGRLHIGHYVGSLSQRVKLQNEGNYDKLFIMIADTQALTDNSGNPQKIRDNILEVMLDYLAVGLDPKKVNFLIQSEVSALPELTAYYMNLVTLPRLLRNPTVKSEIKMRGFNDKVDNGIPVGFANYPISQAADITAFKANIVPVGDDQLPMVEQTREIVKSFNTTYKEVLVMPEAMIPKTKECCRLPGLDGNAKMSKSLENCIYISDDEKTLKEKVQRMYTDPTHIKITDPGHIEGNIVFVYLDVFSKTEDFAKYYPKYKDLADLKKHYKAGGVGDSEIKTFLFNVLNEILTPMRERRKYYASRIPEVFEMLKDGTKAANEVANETLKEVKEAIGLDYFSNDKFLEEQTKKFEK
jgi:tryptophanyl-tRNA synthetase